MLYTIDYLNGVMRRRGQWIRGVKLGAHILDDCDKDTYGLEQAVDFIKGTVKMQILLSFHFSLAVTERVRASKIKRLSTAFFIKTAHKSVSQWKTV